MAKGITKEQVMADCVAALDIPPEIEETDVRLNEFKELPGWEKLSDNGVKGRLKKCEEMGHGRLLLVQVRPGVRATVWRPAR
jgi:hypothetical protein